MDTSCVSSAAFLGHAARGFFRQLFFFVLGHLAQLPERKSFMNQQRYPRNAARCKRNQPDQNRRSSSGLFFYSKNRRVRKEGRHLRTAAYSRELQRRSRQRKCRQKQTIAHAQQRQLSAKS